MDVTNVAILLRHGANVLAVNKDAGTALHISAWNGDHAMSHMLIRAGARVDAVNKLGYTPLTASARFGHVMVTVVLLMEGANVNHRLLSGETPLFKAAEVGSLEKVNVLLRAKANPMLSREKDGEVQTFECLSRLVPLDMAAQNGHNDVVWHQGVWRVKRRCSRSPQRLQGRPFRGHDHPARCRGGGQRRGSLCHLQIWSRGGRENADGATRG